MPRKKRYYNPWGQGGYEFDKWLLNLAPAEGQNAYQAQEAYNAYAKNSETGMQGSAQNYGEAGLQNTFQNMLSPEWEAERDNAQAAIKQGWQQQLQGLNGPKGRPDLEYSFEVSQNSFYDNFRVPIKTSSTDPFYWKQGVTYTGKSKFTKEVIISLEYLLSVPGVGDVDTITPSGKILKGNVIKDFLKGGKHQNKKISIIDPILTLELPSNKKYLIDYLILNGLGENNIFATGALYESGPNGGVDSSSFSVMYNPFIGIKNFIGEIDKKANYGTPPAIMLLHEFAHAWLYSEGIPYSIESHENFIVDKVEIPAIDKINAKKSTNFTSRTSYYNGFDLFYMAIEFFEYYFKYNKPDGYTLFLNAKRQSGYSRIFMTDSSITTNEVLPQDFKYLKGKIAAFEYEIGSTICILNKYEQIKLIDGQA